VPFPDVAVRPDPRAIELHEVIGCFDVREIPCDIEKADEQLGVVGGVAERAELPCRARVESP
jgi:hypothetical protein